MLDFLRGWSDGSKEQVFTRGSGTGGSDVLETRAGVWLGVSGDPLDRGEDRMLTRDAGGC
jgi:hypothetical protein